MSTAPSLTEEQRAAAEAADGPHLVVAPPGSGKTEVLTRRALWLVEQSAGEPFRILALTYTNKAAEELAERARGTLGDEAWRIDASTIHAFCLDMLQHYGEAVGVVGEVSIYEGDRPRRLLLGEALATEGERLADERLGDVLGQIDRLRLGLVLPDRAPADPIAGGALTVRDAYRLYEQALDDARTMDFAGLLYRGWRLLAEDPWVASHYRRQYRHVLVDEAQDLTMPQVELLRALCGDELRNVFVVADDDQEVFSFAGASAEHYAGLAQELGATQHRLTTNFRSAAAIVEAAERLRAHIGTLRVGAQDVLPWTTAPGWIDVASFADPEAEASGVAAWVAGLVRDGLPAGWVAEGEDRSLRAEDVCVMARTRFAFDTLAPALEGEGLDVVLRTEEGGLFDSSAGQGLYLALRVLANPRDRASVVHLEQLVDADTALVRVAEDRGAYDADGGAAWLAAWLDRFGLPDELRAVVRHDAHDGVPAALLERVTPPAGEPPDDTALVDRELWEADRDQLAGYWERYAARTRVPDRTLAGLVRQLSRLQRTPPEASGVRLLTPYRAKGLQFRAVVISGMVEGSFPHYRARTERAVDEERRAVYVALTRASRAALLTYPERRTDRWGRVHRDAPSRFLSELGLDAS